MPGPYASSMLERTDDASTTEVEARTLHFRVARSLAGALVSDHPRVVRALQSAVRGCHVQIHAWVLLPDSLQLCASFPRGLSEGAFIASWGRHYQAHSDAALGEGVREGLLAWTAVPVEVGTQLFVSQMYVERLPVFSGLAVAAWMYRWSSLAANAYAEPDPLLQPHQAYLALGSSPAGRAAAYRALFELELDPSLWESTARALCLGLPLGDPRAQVFRRSNGDRS